MYKTVLSILIFIRLFGISFNFRECVFYSHCDYEILLLKFYIL